MRMDFIKRLFNSISELFFPPRCPYCRKVMKNDSYACEDCKKRFPEESYKRYAIGGYLCSAPFLYKDIFKDGILRLKYGKNKSYAKPLSFMLVQGILEIHHENLSEFDLVTCVPMHKDSYINREYNQAKLLARECAEIMELPYADTLIKFKVTQPQHCIKANRRAKNVKGVYRIIDKDLIKDKNILIIDDIITTGHTLGECARILTKGGCKSVNCAVVCSTIAH